MTALSNFYMIRHGSTVANEAGYAAGSLDTKLTETGVQQAIIAEKIVLNLKSEIDYVVHSNLSRTKVTAEVLNKNLKVPVFIINDLNEQCFGEWVKQDWVKIKSRLLSGEKPVNGESLEVFYERALNGVKEACNIHKGKPLIVSHGGIFDAVFNYFNMDELDVENCCLYEFVLSNDGCGLETCEIKEYS